MQEQRSDSPTRDRLEQLTISTERLVYSIELMQKVVDKHDKWIDSHDSHYHDMKLDVKRTEMIIQTWSNKIDKVEQRIDRLTTQLNLIVNDGLKVRGGWFVIVTLASVVMGVVSIIKVFGLV